MTQKDDVLHNSRSARKRSPRKRRIRYPDYTKTEIKAITDRAAFLRELLREFGATLSGFDPGVAANIDNLPPGCIGGDGFGFWGEHLSFGHVQWGWLEPLLVELRDRRIADQDSCKTSSVRAGEPER